MMSKSQYKWVPRTSYRQNILYNMEKTTSCFYFTYNLKKINKIKNLGRYTELNDWRIHLTTHQLILILNSWIKKSAEEWPREIENVLFLYRVWLICLNVETTQDNRTLTDPKCRTIIMNNISNVVLFEFRNQGIQIIRITIAYLKQHYYKYADTF